MALERISSKQSWSAEMVAPFVHFARSLKECGNTGLNERFFCGAMHVGIAGFVRDRLRHYALEQLSALPIGSKVDSEFEPIEVYKLTFGPKWEAELAGFWTSVFPSLFQEAQRVLAELTVDNALERRCDDWIEAIQSFLALRNLIRDVGGELRASEKLGDMEDPALLIYEGETDYRIEDFPEKRHLVGKGVGGPGSDARNPQ